MPAQMMRETRPPWLFVALLLVLSGGTPESALGRNLAEGKSYKLSVAPNYSLCTEAGDATQLTDGEKAGADWSTRSTVGWNHVSNVQVTIDLGKVESIGRVRIHTVGGGRAGVYFPAVTVIQVSEKGRDYRVASAIGSGALIQSGGQDSHTFETADLNVRARYVRLAFQTEERYLFLDEIEVHSGTGSGGELGPVASDAQLKAVFKTGVEARLAAGEWIDIKDQIKRRFRPAAESKETPLTATVTRQMQELDQQLAGLDVSRKQDVAAFQAKCLALRARAASPVFGKGLVYWELDPWADLRGSIFPATNASSPKKFSLSMWQDEYEHAAFGITNLESRAATVKVAVSALLDEDKRAVDQTGRLWLREARAVSVRLGYRVLDALPLTRTSVPGQAELVIPPGQTRVLWVSLYSLDLPAGHYRARLNLTPVGSSSAQATAIPLRLTVAPLRMPKDDQKIQNSYVWDYIRGWEAPPGAAADLYNHGVNVTILHPEALPRPRLSRDRTTLESVDFSVFDKALARRKSDIRWHGVFWGEGPADELFDLKKASEQKLFKQWIRLWVEHLRQKGYGPDRYFFYPYDEKVPENFIVLARLIKEIDPALKIYCNRGAIDPKVMTRIGPYIDIWCPPFENLLKGHPKVMTAEQQQAFAAVRKKYHPLVWTYACHGPGKALSPNGYYRRLSWLAFKHDGGGAGFWVYLSNSNSWDDYDGNNIDYNVVYLAGDAPPDVPRTETMIPSRRWEACREGAEDFEYLHRLQETIQTARKAGAPESSTLQAERILQRCVEDVMEKPTDADRYDRARAVLTRTILDLRKTITDLGSSGT